MAKEKIIYEEAYGTGQLVLKKDKIPEFLHTRTGYECTEINIMKAGTVERNGKVQAFQVLKIYLDIPED